MTGRGKREWREETLAPVVKRFPERQEQSGTESGIEQDTTYIPEDGAVPRARLRR